MSADHHPPSSEPPETGRTEIAIHGARPEPCHFHVVNITGGIGVWIDGAGEEPIANLRLTDDDARRLANAILARRITGKQTAGPSPSRPRPTTSPATPTSPEHPRHPPSSQTP